MQYKEGNNLPRVKVSNQAAIRRIIYHNGPIMRSEIAERLSLALPTITTNINSMISHGIVRESSEIEPASKTIGRKATPIDIADDSRFFIGVEIRHEARFFCVTNYRGKIIYSISDKTIYTDYDENIHHTARMFLQVMDTCRKLKKKIYGVGISIPGMVDRSAGKLNTHNQYNWFDKNISADLAELTQYKGPITVENDACTRAFRVQLFQRGVLNEVPSFAYLYITRGIACPLILNSANYVSTPLGSGELGYMIIDANKPRDTYGNTGSLNALSGERPIISSCETAMHKGDAPILQNICGLDAKPTMRQILEAQKTGDQNIDSIIKKATIYLGIAVANIDNFVHPDTILVDAMIFLNEDNRKLFLDTVYQNSARTISSAPHFIFIDPNELNGALGAAAVAIQTDLETYIE